MSDKNLPLSLRATIAKAFADGDQNAVLDLIQEVLGGQNKRVADKLSLLWGTPACETYLKLLALRRRDPDHVAARPFSERENEFVKEFLDAVLGAHRVVTDAHRSKAAGIHELTGDPLVERRSRARPLAQGQVDVKEADTDSVWAVFNEVNDAEIRRTPAKVQKYAAVPEYPVDKEGRRLSAEQAAALSARAGREQEPQEDFAATQPMELSASVDEASADLNFAFENLDELAVPEPKTPKDIISIADQGPAAQAQRRAALLIIGKMHPKIASQIASDWGQPDCLAYLQQLVFDGYDQTDQRNRSGFKSEVISALMVLLSLHPSE